MVKKETHKTYKQALSKICQIVFQLVERAAGVKENNLQSYLAKEFLFLRALFHSCMLYASRPDRKKYSTKKKKKLEFRCIWNN